MLTLQEVATRCPAVFSTEASHKTSAQYAHIPTIDILSRLVDEGYEIFRAQQTGKGAHGYHMVTLRTPGEQLFSEEGAPEIILTNAGDGTRGFRMRLGIFRFVCANGIIAGTTMEQFWIDHMGNAPELAVVGAAKMALGLSKLNTWYEKAISTPVGPHAQEQFATAAARLRWGSLENANMVNVARRVEDAPDTVWHLFNRVQENLMRPTSNIVSIGATGRRTAARPLTAVGRTIDVNANLFDMQGT
jgi:hypothetical protein